MTELTWPGADNGREGLLKAEDWFSTLEVLSHHEGDSINYFQGSLYEELNRVLPGNSWTGKNNDRSLFRDYQASWTNLGVLVPTSQTDHTIELTEKGRELLSTREVQEFFRQAVDEYSEIWVVNDNSYLVYPYEIIARAIISSGFAATLDLSLLQTKAERLAALTISPNSIINFSNTPTNKRRFRSYLTILENSGAVQKEAKGQLAILDREYIKSLIVVDYFLDNESIEDKSRDASNDDLPDNIMQDLREKRQTTQAIRSGQSSFSKKVKAAYSGCCCITGTKEACVLEAAHILDYRGRQTNFVNNGLLMAKDIHRMFDVGRLFINPATLEIEFPVDMKDARYLKYSGRKIALPRKASETPNKQALLQKYSQYHAICF